MGDATTARRRKHWGWGFQDQQPSLQDLKALAPGIRERLGRLDGEWRDVLFLERRSEVIT